MTARHYVIGMVLWLGLLYFGARWAGEPILWAGTRDMCCEPKTVETIRAIFPMRLASLPDASTATPAMADDEVDRDDSLATEWSVREMRNRALVVFLLWVASGFLIHWVVKRILAGEVDYT